MSNSTKNPQWTVVDEYATSHTHPASRPNTKALQDAHDQSLAAGLPNIAASPAQAKFLALWCRILGVTHALELGTLGGYTAIWLASENPELHVTTIELDAHHVAVARKNIEAAGLSGRIEVIEGEGIVVVKRLREEVLRGERERFGFSFIDADKENNWNYFDLAVEMSTPKAAICVDNVVRRGRVADAASTDARIHGAREVIEKAGKDPRVDSVVIQTVGEKGYDGWLWAVLNEKRE